MNRIITITTLLFLALQVFGQDYKYVNTEKLNIREGAGKEYNVVGQVNKGEKVLTISEKNDWTEIETQNGTKGFVYRKYLDSHTNDNEPQDSNPTGKGFKYGFGLAFQKLFIIVLLIFAGIEYYKSKRVKDGRYSKGYKEIPFTTFELIKFALYSTIICSVIGLFMGIFFWIKSF